MKVLVSGKRGRLGTALARRFRADDGLEVVAWGREELPLEDAQVVRERLADQAFDVLVNAAAMTRVDLCEEQQDLARAVNTAAPAIMAAHCAGRGARFIHLSTDYVFAGEEPGERREEDPTGPLSVYGRTKREGEQAVLGASPRHLVVRTSWVFGPDRPSFPDVILDRAREEEVVTAIADKWSSPCYSEDFAGWMREVLARPAIDGVLHLCNRGACSWQEYGQAVVDIVRGLGAPLAAGKVAPMRLAEMDRFTARRPVHTALCTEKFEHLTGVAPRPWRDALEEFLRGRFG